MHTMNIKMNKNLKGGSLVNNRNPSPIQKLLHKSPFLDNYPV